MDFLDLQKNKLAFEHFWYRAKRELIGIVFVKHSIKKMLILEVGCGAGGQLGTLSMHGNKVVGTDVNTKALDEAKKRGFDVFYQDIQEEVSDVGLYDVVCAFDVLEHIENDNLALKNIYKLLKPGGLFVFTVPAFKFLFSGHDKYLQHYRRYSMKGLKQQLLNNRLILIDSNYWNFILFPFVALKRIITKNGKPTSDMNNLPKLLNLFLITILRLENLLIKINTRLPFGLSIVGVAKKS